MLVKNLRNGGPAQLVEIQALERDERGALWVGLDVAVHSDGRWKAAPIQIRRRDAGGNPAFEVCFNWCELVVPDWDPKTAWARRPNLIGRASAPVVVRSLPFFDGPPVSDVEIWEYRSVGPNPQATGPAESTRYVFAVAARKLPTENGAPTHTHRVVLPPQSRLYLDGRTQPLIICRVNNAIARLDAQAVMTLALERNCGISLVEPSTTHG